MFVRRPSDAITSIVLFVVAVCVVSLGDCSPQILKYVNNNNGYGRYSFEFETSDGTYRLEDGGGGGAGGGGALVVRGLYRYLSPEGTQYTVHYVADRDGYRASSSETHSNTRTSLQKLTDETRYNDRRYI